LANLSRSVGGNQMKYSAVHKFLVVAFYGSVLFGSAACTTPETKNAPTKEGTSVSTDDSIRQQPLKAWPVGTPNPDYKTLPPPSSIEVLDRGRVSIAAAKKELLVAGVPEIIVSGIGDGSDPLFKAGRFGVRPPDDLMAVVADFAGWKLHAHKHWMDVDVPAKARRFRDRALKFDYPYEVFRPRPDSFVARSSRPVVTESSFAPLKCWIFPLVNEQELSGQMSFWFNNGQWQPDGCHGLPPDILRVEEQLGLRNADVRRLEFRPFEGLETIVGYVPRHGRLSEGRFYYWQLIPERLANGRERPAVTGRALNFKEFEQVLFEWAKKYDERAAATPGGNHEAR